MIKVFFFFLFILVIDQRIRELGGNFETPSLSVREVLSLVAPTCSLDAYCYVIYSLTYNGYKPFRRVFRNPLRKSLYIFIFSTFYQPSNNETKTDAVLYYYENSRLEVIQSIFSFVISFILQI